MTSENDITVTVTISSKGRPITRYETAVKQHAVDFFGGLPEAIKHHGAEASGLAAEELEGKSLEDFSTDA